MGKVRTAFTLVELLIVIAILSVLAAVLLPVFSKAREQARRCVCVSNTRQLISASLLYTQDYDEKLPIVGAPGRDARARSVGQQVRPVRARLFWPRGEAP